MEETITFQTAYEELQEIAKNLEAGNYNIDQLGQKVKRAADLVRFCRVKLKSIDEEIEGAFEED